MLWFNPAGNQVLCSPSLTPLSAVIGLGGELEKGKNLQDLEIKIEIM